MTPTIYVYASSVSGDIFIGTCRFSLRRGRLTSAFSYDDTYLARTDAYAIDPSLPLRDAAGFCEGLPGALRDSIPDRWGRHLIDRRMLNEATTLEQRPRTLDKVDYLLGVYDASRQGALRFRIPETTGFQSLHENVPPLVELKRLLSASNKVSLGSTGTEEIEELLDAGSGSLGGARPKASVTDEGRLLLAKFSHPEDSWDVMAWEKTSLDIANAAGLEVPKVRLIRLGTDSALVLERFDRTGSRMDGPRLPYLSAMSLIGARDGSQNDYADVADALSDWCEKPIPELEALFRHIALSVALHNTDDHLRNLGFLRRGGQWVLAPVFDVNINPDTTRRRVTSIFGETGKGEIDGMKELAEVCGLSAAAASRSVASVTRAARDWKIFAKRNGCRETELRLMGPVIEERTSALSAAFPR